MNDYTILKTAVYVELELVEKWDDPYELKSSSFLSVLRSKKEVLDRLVKVIQDIEEKNNSASKQV